MPERQIVRALHFDQPRGVAFKRSLQTLAAIQRGMRFVGATDQQVDLTVAEFVDQGDEALRWTSITGTPLNRMESGGNLDVPATIVHEVWTDVVDGALQLRGLRIGASR